MHFPLILRVCQQDSPEQNSKEVEAYLKKKENNLQTMRDGSLPYEEKGSAKGQRERLAAREYSHPDAYTGLLYKPQSPAPFFPHTPYPAHLSVT